MSGSTVLAPVVSTARRVQAISTGSLVAVVIGWASLQGFDLAYGSDLGAEPAPESSAIAQLVADRVDEGLVCGTKPAFTDDVVFSYEDDGEPIDAAMLTFDQAVAAQKAGAGTIARYCQ